MKSCLSTPKITDWLLGCPTPSPAIPCPENLTTIPKLDQKPKKKRGRARKKTKKHQQDLLPSQASKSQDPNRSFSVSPVPADSCKDGQENGKRLSSMSPKLRQRHSSLDPALVTCSVQLFEHADCPRKDVYIYSSL